MILSSGFIDLADMTYIAPIFSHSTLYLFSRCVPLPPRPAEPGGEGGGGDQPPFVLLRVQIRL